MNYILEIQNLDRQIRALNREVEDDEGNTASKNLTHLTSANIPLQFMKDLPTSKLTELTVDERNNRYASSTLA